ncbi:MAG: thioredoxin-disulfide reductase [Mobiluncus porci]|uniref:Thioredoxin reductase n=1 Tax=Mobiluncus porci TaxID=2652278 RepID=A0A7K0K201_9ACTO|nr:MULTISPECIES: thioredoxin-disulfide reductase [Mobiluncus]MCI6583567.1 thioredoxin-disulfide reductase [Mobiluncus sp.]MDD7540945.1 thioredoxin-disulfide reductase [Mobiluncus porci]MDY5748974.1 thioredoxin-disulfide reductase [Mobiluncus porci]MST49090.1 thioredoxin-disulfide reductase [Mobiluncus porci]
MYDVIIIGSGPSGYTAGIYASRAALKTLIVAGSVDTGGMLMNTTAVENYPGFPEGVQGPDLMDMMREQAERFGSELVYEDATELDLRGDIKTVTTDEGTYQAKAVIIATGSGYRTLDVPGEEKHVGHGVSYCATCDGFFFRDQPIMVVGGGDSAMEEATYLTHFGSSVTVVHRRDELRASAAMQAKAFADPKIQFKFNKVVESINGEAKVETVTLRDTVTGQKETVAVGGLFIAAGHIPRTELVKDQLKLDEQGNIWVDSPTTATSMPGVFAAGDVTDAIYRQAITSAGTGCKAAIDAERYLKDQEIQSQI